MGAPLVLRLSGPEPVPTKGDIVLQLEIVTSEPINVPVALKVTLPTGVRLISGKTDEVLQIPQAGTLKREYLVGTSGAFAGAIVVTADTKTASGGTGMHAERKYPKAPSSPTTGSTGPRPPVPRPAGPPR
jgi:hypothetical protein